MLFRSNTTFRPYFAAAVAPGTYTITCSASGLPGIPNFTATVTVSGYRYFIPNASSPDSILSDVVTALNAASFGAGWSGLFGITYVGASTVEGITYRLTYSAHKFSILVGSTTFPLPAIGMTQASHPSTVTAPYYIANTQQPSRTWFPKVVANDLGQLPMMTQVTASEPTSDGSTVFVNQGDDPTTRPQWHTVIMDDRVGYYAARAQLYRQRIPQYAAAAGVSTASPYIALDSPDGWWSRMVRGEPFIMGDEASATEYIGPCYWRPSQECPTPQDSLRGLRDPSQRSTGAYGGRRSLSVSFLVAPPV